MAEYTSYEDWKIRVDLRDQPWSLSAMDERTIHPRMVGFNGSPKIVLQQDIIPKEHRGTVRSLTVSEDFLKERFQCYSRLWSEQAILIDQNIDLRKTILAARTLPNLQSAQSYEMLYRPNNFFDALVDTEESPIPFLSRLQRATLLRDPFLDYGSHRLEVTSSNTARPLGCLLSALSRPDGPSRVQRVAIDAIPWCFWQRDLDISYWDYYRFILPQALQSVRNMRLNFCLGDLGEYSPDPSSVLYQIVSFLSATPQVEVLKLTFYNADNVTHSGEFLSLNGRHRLPDVSEVFKQTTWPRLRWLKLGMCAMNEDAFVGFMRRHSQHLKTFKVRILEMTDPSRSWQRAIETIAPSMAMDTVRIKRLHDEDFKQIVLEDREIGWGRRQGAYYAGVSEYLKLGGKRQYPIWGQEDKTTSRP